MQEEFLHFIKHRMAWVSEKVEYSVSGSINNIVREGLENYKPITAHDARYQILRDQLDKFEFIPAFQTILKTKIGDCNEQSLFLGMTLKKSPMIDTNYVIFKAHTLNTVEHTFLILIPRNAELLKNHPELKNITSDKNGAFFLKNKEHLIIADTWRKIIYNKNIDACTHPLDFKSSIPFSEMEFELQNIDVCYLDLQSKFLDFYKPIIINKLLSLAKDISSLKIAIEKQDYNLALRKACVSSKHIEIVKILLENKELLGVNILSKGTKSGDALKIATDFKNTKAEVMLNVYLNPDKTNQDNNENKEIFAETPSPFFDDNQKKALITENAMNINKSVVIDTKNANPINNISY